MGEVRRAHVHATGWQTVPLMLAVLAFGAHHAYSTHIPMDSGTEPVVKQWLLDDYARYGLEALNRGNVIDIAANEPERLYTTLPSLATIEIRSITARGSRDEIIVRAEVSVDGQIPPDGQSVRYLRMRNSMIAGWRVRWETTASSYYLKLW